MTSTQEDMVAAALTELSNSVSVPHGVENETHVAETDAGGDALSSSPADATEAPQMDKVQGTALLPVEPRVIQFIKISKSRQNHSYSDFSTVPAPEDYETPTDISAMSFAEKLHDILSRPENSKTIRWMPHGRAFHVDIPKNMEKYGILMKYFNHGRYSSFLRQLNNHGFKHLTVGPDRNCYYHECFLQGLPHLTRYMPPSKDARRLIADPDTEPNFYTIAKAYPLPSQVDSAATDSMKAGCTIVPEPLSSGQQLQSDGMPPPPSVPVQSMNSMSPLAAILCSAMNQGAPAGNVPVPQVSSIFQQANPVYSNLNLPEGNVSTSNSLLAAFTQGTFSFPNNIPQLTGNPPVLQPQGGNTTLNLLEALLVRQSQVTKKHGMEHPASVDRPAKVPRFAPVPMAPPAANVAAADQRIQDVAQGLAAIEQFRCEAQRLEAERKQAEEREKLASANAAAAQAMLLAAILGNNAPAAGPSPGGT